MAKFDIIDVTESNVDETGFFCAATKRGTLGYEAKLAWLKDRFREGLRIKMAVGGGNGFIEYIPGEYAWRAVEAPGYMVVHCLWVVGREKGRGCGTALLEECVREARDRKMHGVAAVTAIGETGLCDTGFYLKNGFQLLNTCPPGVDLVTLKFHRRAPDPRFTGGGAAPDAAPGNDVTVFYTQQCPYVYDGLEQLGQMGDERGMRVAARNLASAEEVRREAPSPFGTFVVCRGDNVLTHLVHHSATGKLRRRLQRADPVVQNKLRVIS